MKENLDKLYQEMEQAGIRVINHPFMHCKSMALEEEKVVGIDSGQMANWAEEYTVLIHEKGHFDAGAFYDPNTSGLLRGKAENRADRAAIRKYIPEKELQSLLKKGVCQRWELAEHFGVTEDFMEKAIVYYQNVCGIRLGE